MVRLADQSELRFREGEAPATNDASFLWGALRSFTPRRDWLTIDWFRAKIVTDQKRAYDHESYPHIGAPGGPADEFDNPYCRSIALQWATRLGKTFFGQAAVIRTADTDPAQMLFVSANEKLAIEVTKRTYKMLRARAELAGLLLKCEADQKQDLIEFNECEMFVGWARSAATLADKNIKVGHANELDEWEHPSTSKDGDPQELFTDRFKDYQSHRKVIFESVPKVRGVSRIEALRKQGTNCRLSVPCPKCKRYQTLEFGTGLPYGVKWEKDENDNHTLELASRTAHYICRHCAKKIDDHDRPWMIRRGVWCPEGAEVIDKVALKITEHELRRPIGGKRSYVWSGWKSAPWIKGRAVRDGEEASYQLSSLYALSLRWGDLAKEFVKCHKKPQKLRNFVNQWLGETWEASRSKTDPEKVGERLNNTLPRGVVPVWGRFLTVAVDRQQRDGGFVVYEVMAHGPSESGSGEPRAAVIDFGERSKLVDLWEDVIRRKYEHADGGPPLIPEITLIDSGWDTKHTYSFCNAHPGTLAIKGSDSLQELPYQLKVLEAKNIRTGADGQRLLHIATDFWEEDLQDRLDAKLPGEEGCLELCEHAARHEEFLKQLCNGTLGLKVDRRGSERKLWIKKDGEDSSNDHRDTTRYNLCAGKLELDHRKGIWPERKKEERETRPRVESESPRTVATESAETGGGFVRRPQQNRDGSWVRKGERR